MTTQVMTAKPKKRSTKLFLVESFLLFFHVQGKLNIGLRISQMSEPGPILRRGVFLSKATMVKISTFLERRVSVIKALVNTPWE